MYLSDKVGNYLRNKRREAGLTQIEVSDHFGYASSQFISNIERGISAPPSAIMKALVKLYNISKNEFLDLLVEEYKRFLKKILGIK